LPRLPQERLPFSESDAGEGAGSLGEHCYRGTGIPEYIALAIFIGAPSAHEPRQQGSDLRRAHAGVLLFR
jgi:hypothetical protein